MEMTEMTLDQDKKERIAGAFQKHFQYYGFKKTSVDDIAKDLKISKKTIYQFYNSKEKIFYYIVSQFAHQRSKKMEKELSSFPTYKQKITTLINSIFSETRKWIKKNDAFEFKYKYEIAELAFKEAFNELLKKLIQAGMDKGEFPALHLDLTIRFIIGIISESMKLVHANPDLTIEDEVINSIFKLLK